MALAISDILEFRLTCGVLGDQSVNVFHAQVSNTAGTVPTEAAIAAAQFTRLQAAMQALMSNQSTMNSVTCQKILPGPAGAPGFSSNAIVNGTVAADLLPPQVTGMITKRSHLAGRANRGRFYMPYPAESDNTSTGFPVAGYTTRLATLATLLVAVWTVGAGGNTCELTPQILHRTAGTVILWSGVTARTYWCTQRRRNNGNF